MDLDIPERGYAAQVDDLVKASRGVDVTNIYQGINLSNIEGIHTARQRVSVFGAQMDKFGALDEELWAETKRIVEQNDLDEPLASQLKQKLTLDETDVYPKYSVPPSSG